MSKQHSSDYKLSAVSYYLSAMEPSMKDTCKIFKCSKQSLSRWTKRYLFYGIVNNKHRKEGSYKITKTHVKFIYDTIKNKPDIFLWQMLGEFHKKFTITLSKSHLINIIKYLNITHKKMYQNHGPKTRFRKEVDYKSDFRNFYNKIKSFKLEDIICINETSIQIGISNLKGRIEIGKRLYKNTNNNDIFKKYTFIVAISNKKTIYWKLFKKYGIDTSRFKECLRKILNEHKNKLIIMDNASSQRNNEIRKFVIDSKNDYLYILPYKHFLNCIEHYFNQLKHYLRQEEPMNYNNIRDAIRHSIKKIKPEHYNNYFINAYDRKNMLKKYKDTKRLFKKSKIYKN